MNGRGLRRYLDDLARGQRPKSFHVDDSDADEIRTAIDLRASRPEGDAPRAEFLADLHRRLAEQQSGATEPERLKPNATRRQVVVGTSAAAAAAVAAVSVDRLVVSDRRDQPPANNEAANAAGELQPNVGRWIAVAAGSEVPDGAVRPFDLGVINGFIRRVDGKPEAVSGVCTHQGCRLWLDAPEARLRCPCHSTSFSAAGQVLTHQLPIAPKPLPKFMVREVGGVIEVFAPPDKPA